MDKKTCLRVHAMDTILKEKEMIKTWMNFKCILLIERNHSETNHPYCMIVIIRQSGTGKTTEMVKEFDGYQEFGGQSEDGIGEAMRTF